MNLISIRKKRRPAIALLLELDDGLPHSMDQCVDGVYDKCDIEYEIPLIGH